MPQRAVYQASFSLACSKRSMVQVVSRIQSSGSLPAGASISRAQTAHSVTGFNRPLLCGALSATRV
jgi:hypothetical protein